MTEADIDVDDAIKMLVSGGILASSDGPRVPEADEDRGVHELNFILVTTGGNFTEVLGAP